MTSDWLQLRFPRLRIVFGVTTDLLSLKALSAIWTLISSFTYITTDDLPACRSSGPWLLHRRDTKARNSFSQVLYGQPGLSFVDLKIYLTISSFIIIFKHIRYSLQLSLKCFNAFVFKSDENQDRERKMRRRKLIRLKHLLRTESSLRGRPPNRAANSLRFTFS